MRRKFWGAGPTIQVKEKKTAINKRDLKIRYSEHSHTAARRFRWQSRVHRLLDFGGASFDGSAAISTIYGGRDCE